MADVLKTTNWWSANPPAATIVDVNATGASMTRAMTAAEAHDANDTTYAELSAPGDGVGLEGSASAAIEKTITAAAGGIKFLRLKWRARTTAIGGGTASGSVTPLINGQAAGSAQATTGALANYTQDVSVDPATGLAWTPAGVAAATFGFVLQAVSNDPGNWATTALTRCAEFTVEVWGQDIAVAATPASAIGDANAGADNGGTTVVEKGARDPSAVTNLGALVDGASNFVTVRSFLAALADQDVLTKSSFTSPGSATATRFEPLYGAGSQGIVGNSGAGNGINGTGVISGIKLFAIVRAAKSAASSLTNIRFGTGMGVKSLVSGPTIRDYALGLDDTMWERVETALITLGSFGNPFTWGNGVDSVWSQMFGWTFNHTYNNPGAGDRTQLDVAEAWVEVHGPIGTDPIVIALEHTLNLSVKVQQLESSL